MTNLDFDLFASGNPFANIKPHSVEWWLNNFDPNAGKNGLLSPEYENWKKAKEIIEERQRVAEQRQAEERAARQQFTKELIQYSDKIANEIVERIASGELLTVICRDAHMPNPKNITRWLKIHQDFNLAYQAALLDRCTIFAEDMVRFADEIPNMPQRATASNNKEKIQFVDPVQKAKLQIEIRHRHLKAFLPAHWAEQSTLNVRESNPFDFDHLSDAEIEKTIAELNEKEKTSDRDRPHFRASQQGQK